MVDVENHVNQTASLLPKYKFYSFFENAISEDYITEKTYRNALMNKIVPVIISGANLSNPAVHYM